MAYAREQEGADAVASGTKLAIWPRRESVGLADLVGQKANGSRWICERDSGVLTSHELRFRPLFGLLYSHYEIVAIRDFPLILRILRSYSSQDFLHIATVLVPVVILFVQDQP